LPPPLDPAPWESGTTIGRYVLLAPLAQGGMAEIWLARQPGLKGFEKLVVIKRLATANEADPEFVEMFLTEARLAAQLAHPNIVQIFDLGEEHGALYMAMEYLDGEDLARIRRGGNQAGQPLPDELSAVLISQAAAGLHYAHTRVGLDGKPLGLVHRDISPQNLIVTWDGTLKVVDFGIAKAATQSTISGKLKGKFGYMSPEQARVEVVDARSDIFSLGVVLFELVTRTRLFTRRTDADMLSLIAGDTPLPRPSERRPDIPAELERIVMKAMARAPADRFQTAREMQEALEAWLHGSGSRATSSAVSDYLRGIFARRIEERRTIIEAAMKADLTPGASARLRELGGPTDGSRSLVRSPHRRLALTVGIGVSVAVTIVALAAWKVVSRTSPQPPPVVVVTPEPPRAPTLRVDSAPAGASIDIDGQPAGTAPLIIELAPGSHTVRASLPGYTSTEQPVTLHRPGERLELLLSLSPAAPPDAGATAEPVPAASPGKPADRGPVGRLSLQTEPWTTVYLKKRKLGDTPLIQLPLPAGTHTLRLVNPESAIERTVEVQIQANKTTVKKLKL
jgi:serine/threonine-protein kinase